MFRKDEIWPTWTTYPMPQTHLETLELKIVGWEYSYENFQISSIPYCSSCSRMALCIADIIKAFLTLGPLLDDVAKVFAPFTVGTLIIELVGKPHAAIEQSSSNDSSASMRALCVYEDLLYWLRRQRSTVARVDYTRLRVNGVLTRRRNL